MKSKTINNKGSILLEILSELNTFICKMKEKRKIWFRFDILGNKMSMHKTVNYVPLGLLS